MPPEPYLIHHLLERAAARHPTRKALRVDGRSVAYGALWRRACGIAGGLRAAGVSPGDRVLMVLENSTAFVQTFFGVLACGAVAVPISPQTREQRLRFILADCEPAAVVMHPGIAAACGEWIAGLARRPILVTADGAGEGVGSGAVPLEHLRCADDVPLPAGVIDADPALIIYTSGSTGQPKGVLLSHLNVLSAARSIQTYLQLVPSDVIYCGLPLSFDYGLYQLLLAAQVGARIVLERNMTYSGAVIRRLGDEGVTVLPGVPTSFELLLRARSFNSATLPALRLVTNTGAALSASTIARLRAALSQARLFSMYGLTECKRVSYLPPEELDSRPGSIGRGMPNQEVWLIDEAGRRLPPGSTGELVVRGSHVMLGYWRRPAETAAVIGVDPADGRRYLRTGDLFRSDEQGYLYFEGRRDDIIKSSGQKVAPREVEAAIEELPGVSEVAVVGVADPLQGQIVKAFVVPLPGYCYQEHAILAHCRERLEPFMVPAAVEIRAELPHGHNGKIDRRQLAGAGLARAPVAS